MPRLSKPYVPYRKDDLTIGNKTGLPVGVVERTVDDEFESFQDILLGHGSPLATTFRMNRRRQYSQQHSQRPLAELKLRAPLRSQNGEGESAELDDTPASTCLGSDCEREMTDPGAHGSVEDSAAKRASLESTSSGHSDQFSTATLDSEKTSTHL
ncbi:hypothetical protein B0H10DRAFT_2011625 [Mycena sp. CBHHK59/15]|nr:hypothetical protein B0H10DRAFT_2011625 [Mycena sp. CBHHK59/15]